MPKNDKLINQLKEVARRNRENIRFEESMDITPKIFASVAIALHEEYGFGNKRINHVVQVAQDVWANEKDGVIDKCEEVTGITFVYKE